MILGQAGYRTRMLMPVMIVFALWATVSIAGVNEDFIKAAQKGDLPAVKSFIVNGANVDKKDEYGQTALMAASQAGQIEIVQALIANGANVDKKDDYGQTALMAASASGHKDVVQALLDKGADVKAKQNDGVTALMYASETKTDQIEIVQALIAKRADVNAKDKKDKTALMAASERGHTGIVQALLTSGADVNAKRNDGISSLMWASMRGYREIVKLLLARGADVNAKNSSGGTSLSAASLNGHKEIVQVLLANGADVNAKDDQNRTALFLASMEGHKEIVQALLDKGADVRARAKNGDTALIRASFKDHKEIVELLLARGANVNAKDDKGITALTGAAVTGHREVVQALIDKGADVNAKENNGYTALMLASKEGHKGVVQALENAHKKAVSTPTAAIVSVGVIGILAVVICVLLFRSKRKAKTGAKRFADEADEPAPPLLSSAPASPRYKGMHLNTMTIVKTVLKWIAFLFSLLFYYLFGWVLIGFCIRSGHFGSSVIVTIFTLLIMLIAGSPFIAIKYLFKWLFPAKRPRVFAITLGFVIMVLILLEIIASYHEMAYFSTKSYLIKNRPDLPLSVEVVMTYYLDHYSWPSTMFKVIADSWNYIYWHLSYYVFAFCISINLFRIKNQIALTKEDFNLRQNLL